MKQPQRVDPASNQKAFFDEFQVGAGSTTFKANKEGVCAGGDSFKVANWRLFYNGKAIFGQGTDKEIIIDPETNKMTFGGENIIIDASVPEILVKDEFGFNRVHIGYLPGKY